MIRRPSVRVAFDHSYAALPAPAARLFRLLGVVPGPHVDVMAATALAGVPAAELLDRLCRAHLVEAAGPGRYGCHDLLRRHAAERAHAEETAADQVEAIRRLLGYYLRSVAAARGPAVPADPARPPTAGRGRPVR